MPVYANSKVDKKTQIFFENFHSVYTYEQGEKFPVLQLYSLQDRTVQIGEKLKSRFYLINVWATWCTPCVKEIPSLEKLQRKFPLQDLKIIYISVDYPKDAADLKSKVRSLGLRHFDTLYVNDDDLWNIMPVQAIPVSFIINKEGQMLYSFVGDADWADSNATHFIKSVIRR